MEHIVYVVDDDDAVRHSVAGLLESAGLQAIGFSSAEAFLQHRFEDLPSCVILDMQMPTISGFEVADALRDSGREIPIIFLTGHGTIPMSVRALQNGAVDFFEKPYNSQQMLDRIQATLKQVAERQPERAKRILLRERMKLLSPRERDVLALVLRGDVSKVIGRELNISARTVDVHRASIKEKLGCDSSASLVRDVVLAFGPQILQTPGDLQAS